MNPSMKIISYLLYSTVLIAMLGLFTFIFASTAYAAAIPYRTIARDGDLELLFNDRTGAIQIMDHRNNHLWRSVVDDTLYDLDGVNRLWATDMRSPLVINHSNILLRDAPIALLRSYDFVDWVNPDTNQPEQTIFSTPMHNGVEVEYRFPSLGLSVTVLYWLEDGALVVRIPVDRIIESSYYVTDVRGRVNEVRQAVTAITPLPWFGAAHRDDEGYIFYPDGSGAITRFENWQYRPQAMNTHRWHIFSDTTGSTHSILYGIANSAFMPVFGIRNNNNAFLAAITEGYDKAVLSLHPAGQVVDLYRANFALNTRGTFEVNMNAITGATGRATQMAIRVDNDMIPIDKEMRYFILQGDDANYSGMARAYRDFLLSAGDLQNNITAPGRFPLYLQIFMGIEEQGMLFNTFVPMTTFDQSVTMLTALQNQGVQNIETMLRGWQNRGYNWRLITWPPASQLGGRRGLTRLDNYLAGHPNVNVHLENQFNFAHGTRGFSARRDVAVNGVRIPLQSSFEDFFALRPVFSAALNREFMHNLRNLSNMNVAYQALGHVLFSDYNRNETHSRGDAAQIFAGMTDDAVQNNRRVMIQGANSFMLRNANFLYNLPNSSRRIFITDECVPFVQMVTSGLMGHSAEMGNLATNLQVATLRWVEYGSVPAFELTYRDSVNLQNTGYSNLFTSTFGNWIDDVVAVYAMLNERIGHVFGQQMVSHERIAADVVRVAYEDGTVIFINYNEHSVTVGDIVIPPLEFIVVR